MGLVQLVDVRRLQDDLLGLQACIAGPIVKWHPGKASSARLSERVVQCGLVVQAICRRWPQKLERQLNSDRCDCSTGTAFKHSSVRQAAADELDLHIADNLLIAEKRALTCQY